MTRTLDNNDHWLFGPSSIPKGMEWRAQLTKDEIISLLKDRNKAKNDKNLIKADQIRYFLLKHGVQVVDRKQPGLYRFYQWLPNGTYYSRKNWFVRFKSDAEQAKAAKA